jgi:hypothetical protein
MDRFSSILILSVLKKTAEKMQVLLKTDRNNDTLHADNIPF